MDLRIGEYCGMEYSAQESICPICGRPASPSATVIPGTEAKAEKKQPGARAAKGGKFAAKKARSVLCGSRAQNRRNRRSLRAATPMPSRSG